MMNSIPCNHRSNKLGLYMSNLNVDQKNIVGLFSDKKANFLIPDYQRPYAWTSVECQTLWDDIFAFAFPDNDYSKFDTSDEYFLGPVVTFKNRKNQIEIIDGQQRLTTLMLLLRAFYSKYGNMKDENSKKTREMIEKCIWKTDEFGNPDKNALKIDSQVATDNDKDEFLKILRTGSTDDKQRSNYSVNYKFFQEKIDDFLSSYPSYFSYLPARILNNCILLPIEAESQDTALKIFSTLNDRGLPLSDSDIFKSKFYEYYSSIGKKDEFIKRWKSLEEQCVSIFSTSKQSPMDELFSRYMYFERAKKGIKLSTTEALRKFYEKDSYALLKNETTLSNMEKLAEFWNDVENQDIEKFSDNVLKKLFVLHYSPNSMWTYFVSVYFMHNKDENGLLNDEKFQKFLDLSIAFIWAYGITSPGVNALRTPVYAEMVNIVNDADVTFSNYKFESSQLRNILENFKFYNGRPITKSMIAWWEFSNFEQNLLSLETSFEIEHIYAKNRYEYDGGLSSREILESIGNKAFLEKKINIRASDYKFADKKRHYKGNDKKKGTNVKELIELADSKEDFEEKDIKDRKQKIIDAFVKFLSKENLLE